MHELSFALGIIEGVEDELDRRPEGRVVAVHLRLGPLSGLVKEALLFSYDLACEGTRLEGSKLEIEETSVVLFCTTCNQERPAISLQHLCCAICDTPSSDIRGGFEMEVFALELVDEDATCNTTHNTTQAS